MAWHVMAVGCQRYFPLFVQLLLSILSETMFPRFHWTKRGNSSSICRPDNNWKVRCVSFRCGCWGFSALLVRERTREWVRHWVWSGCFFFGTIPWKEFLAICYGESGIKNETENFFWRPENRTDWLTDNNKWNREI